MLSIEAIDAFGNASPPTTLDLTIIAVDPRLPVEVPPPPDLPLQPPG